jgi:hypothetical protein
MESIETILKSIDNDIEFSDNLKERINILSEDDLNLLIDSLDFIDKPVTVKKTVRRATINLNGVEKTVSRNIYSIWTEIRKLLKDSNSNTASYLSYNTTNSNSKSEYKELPDEMKEKLGFTNKSINYFNDDNSERGINSFSEVDRSSFVESQYNSVLSTVNEDEIVDKLDRLYENVNMIDKIGELFFRFRLEDKSVGKYSPENTLIINANEYFDLLDETVFPIEFDVSETSWITPFVGLRINKYGTEVEYMVYYGYEVTDAFSENDARRFFTLKGKSDIKLSKFYKDQKSEYLNFWVFFKIVYERIKELKPDIEIVCNEMFDMKNYIQNTLDKDIKDISQLIIEYIKSE